MTFETFAHSILDNAEVPSGPLRERLESNDLSFEGMVSYWNWYKEHYPEVPL